MLPLAASPLIRHSTVADVDEHTEQLIDWALRYEQLDAGAFRGDFTDVRWPERRMQLFVESTSRRVRQRGHLPAGAVGIGVMLAGEGEIGGAGNSALLVVSGAELDFCTPPNCTLAGLVIDETLVRETLADCVPSQLRLLDGARVASAPLLPPQALDRFRAALRAAAEPGAAWREDDLLYSMIELLAAAEPQLETDAMTASQRKRIVDRACEMWLARPDDPPSLIEVCRRVGASPRKLGYCFQEQLGLSPARYVKTIRLNAVRRELRRGEDSVSDIAARWGFSHFGHFSADYKRQFSELPSQTLQRHVAAPSK